MVDDRAASAERISAMLCTSHMVEVEANPGKALFRTAERNFDL